MTDNLHWRNFCLGVKISINSGAALLLFLGAFFLLFHLSVQSDRAANLFPVAIAALTGAFTGFLIKRHTDKRTGINAEVEKLKIGNGGGK